MSLLPPLASLLMGGCGLLASSDDGAGGGITWSGYVLDGPYTGQNEYFTGGTFEAWSLEGELLAEGEEPLSDTPGYWSIEVEPDSPVAFRLAGEEMAPVVWRAQSPPADGGWFTGALFALEEETWIPYMEELQGAQGLPVTDDPPPALGDGNCWLWGAPLALEGWEGADITVTGGDGEEAQVYGWALDDFQLRPATGDDAPYWFLAFDVACGDVKVEVEAPGGRMEAMWPAWDGEVVIAWFLALSED